MPDHTPVPWKLITYTGHTHPLDGDWKGAIEGPHEEKVYGGAFSFDAIHKRANAEFIVHACNSHDELKAITKEAIDILTSWQIDWERLANDPDYKPTFSSGTLILMDRLEEVQKEK